MLQRCGHPDRLLVEHLDDDVLAVWLDRPDVRNAVDQAMVDALLAVFTGASARAVVLGSRDPACFCAGADLRIPDGARASVSDALYDLYAAMVRLPAPIVAVLEGPAVGGGAQLALAADLRVAGPSASLRFAGPGHGLAVGAWGLPALVGRGRAADLCLSMRTVGAAEAHEVGLVDRIDEDPRAAGVALARSVARLDASAAQRIKQLVHGGAGSLAMLREEQLGNRAAWDGSVAGLTREGREAR